MKKAKKKEKIIEKLEREYKERVSKMTPEEYQKFHKEAMRLGQKWE